MNFILDDKKTESQYKKILELLKLHQNGDISDSMKSHGISYKLNWGVSITELRDISKSIDKNHLLALKLWNKQWRETMILATLIDNPAEVSEEQMDFWTKSFENPEIAEQASTNLWVKSRFAFIKALEWCRGKKHLVRFTGIHLLGRLAITEKNAIDEMFEPFFEELETLAKDKNLYTVIYRALIAVGTRSKNLNSSACDLAKKLAESEFEHTKRLGNEIFDELSSEYISFRF